MARTRSWINVVETGTDGVVVLGGSEWRGLLDAMNRYVDTGEREVYIGKGVAGGLSALRVDLISSMHYFSQDTWESAVARGMELSQKRSEIRLRYPGAEGEDA